jgi:hypothetical protein
VRCPSESFFRRAVQRLKPNFTAGVTLLHGASGGSGANPQEYLCRSTKSLRSD